jgi:hypothetical protein
MSHLQAFTRHYETRVDNPICFASRRSPVRSRLAPLDRNAAKGSFLGDEESGRRRLRLGPACMRGASVLAWRRCGSSLLLLAPKRQRAATHAPGEYGVSCIVRRGPCLRAGAGICAHGFRVAPYVRQQRFASHGVAEIVARLHQNEPRGRQESRGSILRTSSLTMSRQTTESAAKEWSRSGRLRLPLSSSACSPAPRGLEQPLRGARIWRLRDATDSQEEPCLRARTGIRRLRRPRGCPYRTAVAHDSVADAAAGRLAAPR